MVDAVRFYDELVTAQTAVLRRTLTDISEAELDWRPHPVANPIRWILGHHVWYETWVPDAIQGTGRYLTDTRPLSFEVADGADFWTRFEAEAARRRGVYEALTEADLERTITYLNQGPYTVARLVRTHAGHFTGHSWQARYIRGAYSRAFGTDKSLFDPV